MKLHPIQERGAWFMVSSKYAPASPGSVGGGMIIAKPYSTRAACRAAIRIYYKTGDY